LEEIQNGKLNITLHACMNEWHFGAYNGFPVD